MAEAKSNRVIQAPIEKVWEVIRDFNGLPRWCPSIVESEIEDGLPADRIGCIRIVKLASGASGRERLLALDDSRHLISYNFETSPLPVLNYVSTLELSAADDAEHTRVSWSATFDEVPEHVGKFGPILSEKVFAPGLASLDALLTGTGR